MRRAGWGVLSAVIGCGLLWAADWATESGSPQRDGWLKGEKSLVKEKAGGLHLLYRATLDNASKGANALSSPLVLGNLITYRGFKEMLFVGGSADNVYSIDADLNRLLWKTHFDVRAEPPAASGCAEGMTAGIAMPGSATALGRGATWRRPGTTAGRSLPSFFGGGFGRNGSVFAVSSDGWLRIVRQSDGNDTAVAPVKFVPPNSQLSSLNVGGAVVYAGTRGDCGGPNALYAVDLDAADHPVKMFPTNGSGPAGAGATAIGSDGTVYLQVARGHGEAAGEYQDTVLALTPGDLTVKDYFTPAGAPRAGKSGAAVEGVTPAVFRWKGRDVIVAGGADGRLYLLDSKSLGGPDHHTPLARSEPVAAANGKSAGRGWWGDFATWEDADANQRWIYAALRGPARAGTKIPATNGAAPDGSIVAFQVEERGGRLALAPRWISRNLLAPAAPVTTNGLVFALATGDSPRGAKPAALYVLDGATGKELFATGKEVRAFSHASSLAAANGRVYFTTHDNAVYCYGFPAEQPQLTEP